jgi:hypothetical protein
MHFLQKFLRSTLFTLFLILTIFVSTVQASPNDPFNGALPAFND